MWQAGVACGRQVCSVACRVCPVACGRQDPFCGLMRHVDSFVGLKRHVAGGVYSVAGRVCSVARCGMWLVFARGRMCMTGHVTIIRHETTNMWIIGLNIGVPELT